MKKRAGETGAGLNVREVERGERFAALRRLLFVLEILHRSRREIEREREELERRELERVRGKIREVLKIEKTAGATLNVREVEAVEAVEREAAEAANAAAKWEWNALRERNFLEEREAAGGSAEGSARGGSRVEPANVPRERIKPCGRSARQNAVEPSREGRERKKRRGTRKRR